MKAPFSYPLLVVWLVFQMTDLRAADAGADELIRRIREAHERQASSIRAKLTVADSSTDRRSVAQILIKQRRDADTTRILYQVLWPSEHKGEAVVVTRSGEDTTAGFLFKPPDKITDLTSSLLSSPYLQSDLALEDIAEDHWRWPAQTISGEETIKGDVCRIIESRPPPGLHSSYSLIRSYVSLEKLLPVRSEKFDRDGRLAKEILISKSIRQDKTWSPGVLLIRSPGKTQETMIEISRGNPDAHIALSEFSLDAIKESARSAPVTSPKEGETRQRP